MHNVKVISVYPFACFNLKAAEQISMEFGVSCLHEKESGKFSFEFILGSSQTLSISSLKKEPL
jgi:hypothetical protein